jgi:hypothetical protein
MGGDQVQGFDHGGLPIGESALQLFQLSELINPRFRFAASRLLADDSVGFGFLSHSKLALAFPVFNLIRSS